MNDKMIDFRKRAGEISMDKTQKTVQNIAEMICDSCFVETNDMEEAKGCLMDGVVRIHLNRPDFMRWLLNYILLLIEKRGFKKESIVLRKQLQMFLRTKDDLTLEEMLNENGQLEGEIVVEIPQKKGKGIEEYGKIYERRDLGNV